MKTSFWSRLAAAAKAMNSADALGSAIEAAIAAKNDGDAQSIGDVLKTSAKIGFGTSLTQGTAGLGQINAGLKAATSSGPQDPGFSLLDAAHFPYDYLVNRPLGTLALGENALLRGQFDKDNPLSVWRKAWNDTDTVSLGQAYAALAGAQSTDSLLGIKHGINDPRNPAFQVDSQAAQDYFHHTATGVISSGAIDLAANIFADPLVLGGKGVKAARIAKTTFGSNVERDAALDLAAGNLSPADAKATLGRRTANRAQRGAEKMDDWLRSTYGNLPSEVMQDPRLRDTSDAGTLAYWFTRADQTSASPDDALKVKRDLFAVALGNTAAIQRVSAHRADLAGEVIRMSSPVEQTTAAAKFSWDDSGQGMIDFLNSPTNHAEIDARAQDILDEIGRLDQLSALQGSTSKFGVSALDAVHAQARVSSVQESILTDGLGSRPIRVVRGAVGKSTPGHINVVDTDDGHDALRLVLSRANMPGAVRAKFLDEFAQAPTREARYQVVQNADQAIFQHLGAKYGKSRHEINALMTAARARRGSTFKALQARLYSAADDARYIAHVDEEGVAHAFDRPFLRSQIEDMAPITDPGVLERVLHNDARTGWVGEFANNVGDARAVVDDIAMRGTRAWKDLALMRLAYPMRIQVDSQLRLMAGLGVMDYMLGAARGVKNKVLRAPSDMLRSEMFRGVDIAPARDAEEFARVASKLESHNTLALMVGDENRQLTNGLRATGNFDVIKGAEPNWGSSQLRAVNRQIRNSPTATRMLTDMNDASVARFVQSDKNALAEWNNFKSQYESLDDWLQLVRAHVNHTLPTPELRITAAERDLNAEDLTRFFDDVTTRPAVHGESFVPFIESPANRWWSKVRERFYRRVSDMPESVMARHPYYNARFRTHMREAINRLDGETLTQDQVDNIRRVADRKARKDMSNTLFDVTHQSNLAHGMRFLSPFFAAWEDVMVKWGHLFYDDPSTAVRFTQAWTAPEKLGLTSKDDQGVEYVNLPKSLAPILPEGAKNWAFRKDSFNIVFQGEPWWLPGFGPAVQVPVNEIVKSSFPEHADAPVLKYILPLGVSDDGPATQLLPAWAKRLKASGVLWGNGGDDYASTYAMLMAQEQIKYRNGQRKSKPDVGEIANATRNWFLMRTLSSFASPVTANPSPEFQFYMDMAHRYRDEVQQTRAEFAAWKAAGSKGDAPPESWEDRFYRDFPDYFDMSISLSQNNTGIVASDKAAKAQRKYKKMIAANPQFGWAVVGPDNTGDFSQGVYANQMTQALGYGNQTTSRSRKDPQQALKDTQAERGWIDYRKGMTLLNVELEARGLHSLAQAGARDLAGLKQEFIARLSSENPAWADAYGPGREGKAQEFLRYANDSLLSGSLAKRPDMKLLATYVQGRRTMQAALAARGATRLPAVGNVNSPNADLRAIWDGFTSRLVADNIGFEQMWQRVLETDDLGGDL